MSAGCILRIASVSEIRRGMSVAYRELQISFFLFFVLNVLELHIAILKEFKYRNVHLSHLI